MQQRTLSSRTVSAIDLGGTPMSIERSPLGGTSNAGKRASRPEKSRQVADAHGVSAYQVNLAWELAHAPVLLPIPGASRPASILDSAAAADLELTIGEVATLSEA